MPLYAAYGSNLDPSRMSERCPHSPLRSTGWLTGWRLTFGGEEHGWDGALVTIVQFSEFQCPFCKRVEPTLAKLRDAKLFDETEESTEG